MKIRILLFALIFTLGVIPTSACALPQDTGIVNNYIEVSAQKSEEIISKYQDELSYINSMTGESISCLNSATIQIIKISAVTELYNENYNFRTMMEEIALACAQEIDPGSQLANIDSYRSSSYSSYGILSGMHLRDVAVGASTTITYSETFSLAAGSTLLGVELGSEFTQEFSYSIAGPSSNLTLYNGSAVTHRTSFAVLYGSVLVDSYGNYFIEPSSAVIVDYTLLSSIGIPTYCDTASSSGTYYFSNPLQFRQAFDSPSPFI